MAEESVPLDGYSVIPSKEAPAPQPSFRETAEAWLETRIPFIGPKTAHEYKLNIKRVAAFFKRKKLEQITADDIRAYQRMRMETCGPSAINHETSVLQQMLKRAGLWAKIAPDFPPLPLPKLSPGRALTADEYKALFRAAASNPMWEAAWLFARISVNTTAGPQETPTLRIRDVDLVQRLIVIQPEGAKNVHRIRAIPLNDDAYEADPQSTGARAGTRVSGT